MQPLQPVLLLGLFLPFGPNYFFFVRKALCQSIVSIIAHAPKFCHGVLLVTLDKRKYCLLAVWVAFRYQRRVHNKEWT